MTRSRPPVHLTAAVAPLLLIGALAYGLAAADLPVAKADQHQVEIVVVSCEPNTDTTRISVGFPPGPFEVAIEDADDFVRWVRTPGSRLDLPPGAYEWVFIEIVNEEKIERGRGGFTIDECEPPGPPPTPTSPTPPSSPPSTSPPTSPPASPPTPPPTLPPTAPDGAIGDYVWFDVDADGVQDTGEPPVAGATVELLTAGDTGPVATQITGVDGRYRFEGLADGDYRVRFVREGSVFTSNDATGDDADSDAIAERPGVGLTGRIQLSDGRTDLSWDAGILCPAVLPWDGISDQVVTEDVVRRVELVAPQPGGRPLAVGIEGHPAFASLADHGDGTATLTIDPRSGDEGRYREVTLVASNGCTSFADTFDIRVLPGPREPGATVAGRVFVDSDGDGAYDRGEPLESGVSIVVAGEATTTAVDGSYSIDVAAGNHLVRLDTESLRDGLEAVRPSRSVSVRAGTTGRIDFPVNASAIELILKPTDTVLGTGDTVEVTVEVLGGTFGQELVVELDGGPRLAVEPPEITVNVGTPQVVAVTGIDPGLGTLTGTVPGATGSVPLEVLEGGTISGVVFNDHNGNGVQDDGETLVSDDRGFSIRVVEPEGPEVRAGARLLGGRTLGSARLQLPTAEIPVEGGRFRLAVSPQRTYELSVVGAPNSIPGRIVLVVATNRESFRVGFGVPDGGLGISGTVFTDLNENCSFDEGEEAIVGAGVRMRGQGRDEVTVTAEAEGTGRENYGFAAGAGSYLLSIDPTVLGPVTLSPCAAESIQVVLDEGAAHAGADFPVVSAPLGSIAGTVWCDLDGDNRRDPQDKEVPGVTLVLAGPGVERHTLTQSGGGFEFSGLLPGAYSVRIDTNGLDSVAFADDQPSLIELGLGESRLLPLALCQTRQLAGLVFDDRNGDGARGVGEPGLFGVTVEVDGPGGFRDSTRTDTEGNFRFPSGGQGEAVSSLPLGTYVVRAEERFGDRDEAFRLTSPARMEVELESGPLPEVVFSYGAEDPPFPWLLLIAGLTGLVLLHWWALRGLRTPSSPESGRPVHDKPASAPVEPTPYRGPRPFRPIDSPQFEGRERERRELESLTYPNRILVVYGPSGAGKTSLLTAGYIPGLDTSEFEVLPVARFQLGPQVMDDSIPNVFTFAVVSYLSGTTEPPVSTIAHYLRQRPPLRDDLGLEKARVVVIDEFQEMFRLYRGLGERRQGFFDDVAAALESDPLVRFVFCIDEDEKGELEPYIEQFGPHVVSDYRVEPLPTEGALSAITGPPAQAGVDIDPEAALTLVRNARTVWAEHAGHRIEVISDRVDLMALQVTAEATWRNAEEGPIGAEHVVDWEDGDAALRAVYDAAVHHLAPLVPERRLREWCERQLISPDGNRTPTSEGDAGRAGLPPAVIEGLAVTGLLVEAARGDLTWYELAHDRLVEAIRNSNRLRRERDLIDASAGLLTAAARMWELHGRGGAGLLSDGQLEIARSWASAYPSKVGPTERAYLEASVAASRAAGATSPVST